MVLSLNPTTFKLYSHKRLHSLSSKAPFLGVLTAQSVQYLLVTPSHSSETAQYMVVWAPCTGVLANSEVPIFNKG